MQNIQKFDFQVKILNKSNTTYYIMNILHPKQFANRLKINKLPQRVAGVTAENEPKRVGATLKFFFIKIHKVGLRGWGRSKRNRVGGGG